MDVGPDTPCDPRSDIDVKHSCDDFGDVEIKDEIEIHDESLDYQSAAIQNDFSDVNSCDPLDFQSIEFVAVKEENDIEFETETLSEFSDETSEQISLQQVSQNFATPATTNNPRKRPRKIAPELGTEQRSLSKQKTTRLCTPAILVKRHRKLLPIPPADLPKLQKDATRVSEHVTEVTEQTISKPQSAEKFPPENVFLVCEQTKSEETLQFDVFNHKSNEQNSHSQKCGHCLQYYHIDYLKVHMIDCRKSSLFECGICKICFKTRLAIKSHNCSLKNISDIITEKTAVDANSCTENSKLENKIVQENIKHHKSYIVNYRCFICKIFFKMYEEYLSHYCSPVLKKLNLTSSCIESKATENILTTTFPYTKKSNIENLITKETKKSKSLENNSESFTSNIQYPIKIKDKKCMSLTPEEQIPKSKSESKKSVSIMHVLQSAPSGKPEIITKLNESSSTITKTNDSDVDKSITTVPDSSNLISHNITNEKPVVPKYRSQRPKIVPKPHKCSQQCFISPPMELYFKSRKFVCTLCHIKFNTLLGVESHIKLYHVVSKISETTDSMCQFLCDKCSLFCHTRLELYNHKKLSHVEYISELDLTYSENSDDDENINKQIEYNLIQDSIINNSNMNIVAINSEFSEDNDELESLNRINETNLPLSITKLKNEELLIEKYPLELVKETELYSRSVLKPVYTTAKNISKLLNPIKYFTDGFNKLHCEKCSVNFLSQKDVEKHFTEQHRFSIDYQCLVCSKIFSTRNLLNSHACTKCA